MLRQLKLAPFGCVPIYSLFLGPRNFHFFVQYSKKTIDPAPNGIIPITYIEVLSGNGRIPNLNTMYDIPIVKAEIMAWNNMIRNFGILLSLVDVKGKYCSAIKYHILIIMKSVHFSENLFSKNKYNGIPIANIANPVITRKSLSLSFRFIELSICILLLNMLCLTLSVLRYSISAPISQPNVKILALWTTLMVGLKKQFHMFSEINRDTSLFILIYSNTHPLTGNFRMLFQPFD